MKIVFTEPLGVLQSQLESLLKDVINENEVVFYPDRKEDTETLIERCHDADVIVLTNYQLKRKVLENCANLKYVCVAFTGYNHVDMDYCNSKGITVSNCSGYSTEAVCELVFGLLIDVYRHIRENDQITRNSLKSPYNHHELAGKKFGVVGLGTIGKKVASVASAFGCDVYYYSRSSRCDDYKYLELDELMKTCDIISVHVAQNGQTIDLINSERIAMMKPNAVLINTARGPIVNSVALADALNEGKIAGAGIDVFEMEPPIDPEHPLLHSVNTVVTPHIGFNTAEALEKRAVIVADNIKAFLGGNPINVVK
ncbi:MAG: hydroxyacid dehydrogenase [Erysipelotrichaceae bacterium]|nr:hydroxyacid dehydrogenase [Erysipelotrichaceae bacterium]